MAPRESYELGAVPRLYSIVMSIEHNIYNMYINKNKRKNFKYDTICEINNNSNKQKNTVTSDSERFRFRSDIGQYNLLLLLYRLILQRLLVKQLMSDLTAAVAYNSNHRMSECAEVC